MGSALSSVDLLALLSAGQTVILPSARAAAALRQRYDRQQREHGLQAWEPAALFSWPEWLESLWSALCLNGLDDRMLLNRVQEERLWADVIERSAEGAGLSSSAIHAFATSARSAYEIVAAHGAADRLFTYAETYDARAFVGWEKEFSARCRQDQLLPRASLARALAGHIRNAHLETPESMYFVGFEALTPSQNALLSALEARGCSVKQRSLGQSGPQASVRAAVVLPSPREELAWAIGWIRQRFCKVEGEIPTIALVVPDPATERPELEPLLRQILTPELEPVDADLSSTPWHFGEGVPLASLPIIEHALTLLRWVREDLSLSAIGTLLLSPFLSHSAPFESRARFEMHSLRELTLFRPELSLDRLLRLARERRQGGQTEASFPELETLQRMTGDPAHLRGTGSYADWTERIRRLLKAVGWPGPRTLSPAEFQATEAWEGLLDLLATLDYSSRRPRFEELLDQLQREAGALIAPGAAAGAPLQVLRLAETEGCVFDAALVLRATDENLPAPERPHPLVGWGLQRSLGLAGTDPALTHARVRAALESLSARSGDLLLLAAEADERGTLRLTPMRDELGLPLVNAGEFGLRAMEQPLADAVPVQNQTPLPFLPSAELHGGARVLELQAACGFRAFASLRLQAEQPASRNLGLNARETGSLIHRALELLWTELQTQAKLRALPSEQRRDLVQRCVLQALGRFRISAYADDPWARAYLSVLEQRLCDLLGHWLEHEESRGDFAVLPPEQGQEITVGPLQLNIRPDRIDKVDGGYVLVDYKTSLSLSTEDWLGERPDAPQLPLYALLAEPEEIRGLAFARLRPGKDMTWLSLQDQEAMFPGKRGAIMRDLAGDIERWREELARLAYDFAEGRAEVNPKSYPKTCEFCDFRLICRLNAATLLEQSDTAELPAEGDQHG